MLELVKYRYEPADFVKMILCNAVMLLALKQRFRSMIFLGSPMVMVFVYIYSRTYEDQVMNLLGFFQIRCGWLPFTQMLQDGKPCAPTSLYLAVPRCTSLYLGRPRATSRHAPPCTAHPRPPSPTLAHPRPPSPTLAHPHDPCSPRSSCGHHS